MSKLPYRPTVASLRSSAGKFNVGAPTSSSAADQRHMKNDHGIYGSIDGKPVFATAATESRFNVISREMAESCHLPISQHSSTLGQGYCGQSTTIGRCNVMWTFEGDFMDQVPVEFHVLPKCPSSIVLGLPFLMRTKTLTRNWHRLRVRQIPMPPQHTPSLHLLDITQHAIVGTLAKQRVLALPATGSDLNAVSETFVRARGLAHRIEQEDWDIYPVGLIDGRIIETQGTVTLPWRFGDGRMWDNWHTDFAVLQDIPYDVILGRQLLYESGAYSRYIDFISDDNGGFVNGHTRERDETNFPKGLCPGGIAGPLSLLMRRKHSKWPFAALLF